MSDLVGAEGGRFARVAEVVGDPASLRVYEHGWQSWSPAGVYPATGTSPRPVRELWQTMAFRPERPAPATGFQGEGVLGVGSDEGGWRVFVAADPTRAVASVRASAAGDRVLVAADAPVIEVGAATLDAALAAAAAHLAPGGPTPRARAGIGPGWCSYAGYGLEVTEADVLANLEAMERLDLPFRVVQVDDGYEREIGAWTETSPRFGPMRDVAARIRDVGREAGIWTAPFCVASDARLAVEHPDWLVEGALASPAHWGRPVRVLDVTHPDAAAHLVDTFRTLREWGFTYHKVDFVYAGAMEGGRHEAVSGVEAYRLAMGLVREALGPDATILGCGAPLVASVGLVDAMRVSPDIDERDEHESGDISQPSVRGALSAGRARAWMHGRLWVNDPDCLVLSPTQARRDEWTAHVEAMGGLVCSGDRLPDLDDAGLEELRGALRPSGLAPLAWDPEAGPDGGLIRSA
ncbi:MAG TPA: glycoside hydrolase family 36 protein [Candidatus Limnocylindrales bacterium]|nr:glycoside hydrolase family 36 protein [Candidatus Limnocylindrales bacterium]